MTDPIDPVETLARALYDQSARGFFGPYEAVINAGQREAFEARARTLLAQIAPALVAEEVAQEREACAKVADQAACELEAINPFLPSAVSLGKDIAAAIRARKP